MNIALILAAVLAFIGGLAVLLVFPSVKTAIDALIAGWIVEPTETFSAYLGFFPIVALVVLGLSMVWWMLSSK